jgi:hypothetical protein
MHHTRFRARSRFLVLAGLAFPLLAACNSGDSSAVRGVSSTEYRLAPDGEAQGVQGKALGAEGLSLFGTNRRPAEEGSGLGVNAYLWRGALDSLSFMPLASADPFGGVIITDWYQSPASPGERFKVTAYILGRQLRSDGVRISVFRQVARNGVWVDADVAQQTASDLVDKVLARARELRASAVASQ